MTTPPAMPTGLALTTGTVISDDGTIMPWVRAAGIPIPRVTWGPTRFTFSLAPSLVPTTFTVSHPTTHVRLDNVAGQYDGAGRHAGL